jgi:hypothetical protein
MVVEDVVDELVVVVEDVEVELVEIVVDVEVKVKLVEVVSTELVVEDIVAG